MSETFEGESVALHNKRAWDKLARANNEWSVPVGPDVIARARRGELSLLLTPTRPVPAAWLGDVRGKRVLGLACGGGQQGPCLAAAGADVTIFDNSPVQLSRDGDVAAREGLSISLVEGDMRDLSAFADETFDLIFHPCSNCFVPQVRPVWLEAYRVLKRGGALLSGFVNPVVFMLDLAREREDVVELKYRAPFSPADYPDDAELAALRKDDGLLEYGHTLDDQIGGQTDAGFTIVAMYEDGWPADRAPIHRLMNCYIATRAVKA
ncbi:MAG: class I SAM-dependent methyltransferase [Alphaproteobacteria bacterium]|nr:class I SAM-dependent methyltransferase [Alphaproteobacteria bacterium]